MTRAFLGSSGFQSALMRSAICPDSHRPEDASNRTSAATILLSESSKRLRVFRAVSIRMGPVSCRGALWTACSAGRPRPSALSAPESCTFAVCELRRTRTQAEPPRENLIGVAGPRRAGRSRPKHPDPEAKRFNSHTRAERQRQPCQPTPGPTTPRLKGDSRDAGTLRVCESSASCWLGIAVDKRPPVLPRDVPAVPV